MRVCWGVGVLLCLVAPVLSGFARADYLVFSGSTYWQDALHGIINSPSGLANLKGQVPSLAATIVNDGDTIVYDFQSYRVVADTSPAQFLSTELSDYNIDIDVSIYRENASAFDCVTGDEDLDADGVLLYIGRDYSCTTPFVAYASPPGDGGNDDDRDNDGVLNGSDNCPDTPNAGQANNDGDSQGDACDIDDDNDGISDVEEGQLGTNPFLFDTDGDGIGDGDEILAGTNPLKADSDGDGWSDAYELANGTDPNDSSDTPYWTAPGMQRGWRLAIPQLN